MSEEYTEPTLLDLVAAKMMMARRGNPAMGGPSPTDYRNANNVLYQLGLDPNIAVFELQRFLEIAKRVIAFDPPFPDSIANKPKLSLRDYFITGDE